MAGGLRCSVPTCLRTVVETFKALQPARSLRVGFPGQAYAPTTCLALETIANGLRLCLRAAGPNSNGLTQPTATNPIKKAWSFMNSNCAGGRSLLATNVFSCLLAIVCNHLNASVAQFPLTFNCLRVRLLARALSIQAVTSTKWLRILPFFASCHSSRGGNVGANMLAWKSVSLNSRHLS